jgi:hypothetical protein
VLKVNPKPLEELIASNWRKAKRNDPDRILIKILIKLLAFLSQDFTKANFSWSNQHSQSSMVCLPRSMR